MLDRQVLKTKVRLARHKLFLPQEVVQQEICTRDLQRRHNYRQQLPQKEMQSTIHLNE
jgi:hypothetical protein